MKNILIITNSSFGLYKFRKEILEKLRTKYKLSIISPNDGYENELKEIVFKYSQLNFKRRSINPFSEFLNFFKLLNRIKSIKPDLLISFTVKPNIYVGIISKILKKPIIANITGLGSFYYKNFLSRNILKFLYRISLNRAKTIFFQNKNDLETFNIKIMKSNNSNLLPGSGVNTDFYSYNEKEYNEEIKFIFIGRIMKEKGIDLYLEAAKILKSRNLKLKFYVCGEIEEKKIESKLIKYVNDGYVIYLKKVMNIKEVYRNIDAIIHPSLHEGMSNVLLEAASSGRPQIASDINGCIEIIEDEITGFIFKKGDLKDLIIKIEKFLDLSVKDRIEMGKKSRLKVIKEFDRDIVVKKYMSEISSILMV